MHIAAPPARPATDHAFAAGGGNPDNFNLRVHFTRWRCAIASKIEVGQQIATFIEQHERRRGKHMRILQRLIFTFGHGKHCDFMLFAQIEAGRANKITERFDKPEYRGHPAAGAARRRRSFAREMAAFAVLSCDGGRAGSADAGGVVHCLLVAFNHRARYTVFQFRGVSGQRGGFTGTRGWTQVEHQLLAGGETGAVALSQTIILSSTSISASSIAAGSYYRGRVGSGYAVAKCRSPSAVDLGKSQAF